MAKRPLYIQLEPGAYPKDTDWLMMTPEERGCYHSLIVFLACNNGALTDEVNSLATLCNINAKKMKSFLIKFEDKFIKKNGQITHKRVTEEIKRAKKRMQVASTSGLKGARKRWGGHSDPITPPIKKPIAKKSKVKKREINTKTKTKDLEFSPSRDFSFKKLFFDEFKPKTDWEKNTFSKYAEKCHKKHGPFHQGKLPNLHLFIIEEIRDIKEHVKVNKKTRKDGIRMFIAKIKKEIGE